MSSSSKAWLWGLGLLGLSVAVALAIRPSGGDASMRAEVYAWHPNGTVARVSPPDGVYYQSCVHPDGTSVIFSGGASGPPRVWKADLKTGVVVPLTPPNSAAFLATFSWDGREIVFSSDRAFDEPSIALEDAADPRIYRRATFGENHRNFNLFVMAADGGNVRQITTGPHRDLRGAFSPDGKRIAFFSTRTLPGSLWTVPTVGGGTPERLELRGAETWSVYRPCYTPDGAELYLFGRRFPSDRRRVYRVPVAGGVPEPLAWDDRGKTQAPFVDPSGEFLLLHTNRTGRCELWEIPLAGGEPRMLEPPGPPWPEDRQVMHPTRSRNGIVTFDVSFEVGAGSSP